MPPTDCEDVNTFTVMCIADMDQDATVSDSGKTWQSLLRKGTLTYNAATLEITADFTGEDEPDVLKSSFNFGGRGMELSDLLKFNGKLYTVCDKTGIVYEIFEGSMIPWVILSTGDGRQPDGFKGEWMTVKDGLMYIGGHGKEQYDRAGTKIVHKDYCWVKTITADGAVAHYDWEDRYNLMRSEAGCPKPGYLTHESGEWSDVHQCWFFLPRKASSKRYDHKKDEQRGTNLLLKCSEDFSDISVIKVGELKDKKRGFSSFKFIPGTDDKIIVAIRSEEVDDQCRTHLCVFTIEGEILLEDQLVSDSNKYEGIEFV